jgi:hypothetical protein
MMVFIVFSMHDSFINLTRFRIMKFFNPGGNHIFELTEQQTNEIQEIFDIMEREFNSGYKCKFDVIRNRISDLIHYGLKLEPSTSLYNHSVNAAYRISRLLWNCWSDSFPLMKITLQFNRPKIAFRIC